MDEAVAHYRTALALDPGANDARTGLAVLLIRQDRAAEAVTMLRSVIAAAPELSHAHFHLGRAIEQAGGSSAEAAAAYQAATRLEPGMAAAHLALGNVLAARGDAAGAGRSVREALRLDANLAGARFALGTILAGERRFDLAMNEYREALRLEPGHVDALANLGNCLLVSRRFREAAATYERVLRLRPGDEAVKENLRLALELERSGAPR
jgi:Flp pilus assembly protein TadD